jgi:hypothetical protein
MTSRGALLIAAVFAAELALAWAWRTHRSAPQAPDAEARMQAVSERTRNVHAGGVRIGARAEDPTDEDAGTRARP